VEVKEGGGVCIGVMLEIKFGFFDRQAIALLAIRFSV